MQNIRKHLPLRKHAPVLLLVAAAAVLSLLIAACAAPAAPAQPAAAGAASESAAASEATAESATQASTESATEAAGAGTGEAAGGEPIYIGVSGPLTGPNAQYGEQWKKGFDLALEEINGAGGIDGRPLEYIFEDSQSDPKQ